MSRKSLLGILALLALGLAACSAAPTSAQSDLPVAPAVGALAPDFALQNLQGDTVRLSDQRGRVVLVNFWATWCGPCRVEMPDIQASFDQHSPDLVVLAVDFDEPQETVQAFVDELNLTFPVLLDPGAQVQSLYQVRGYPSTMFVDEQGVVQIVHIGIMTTDQLDGYLAQMGVAQ